MELIEKEAERLASTGRANRRGEGGIPRLERTGKPATQGFQWISSHQLSPGVSGTAHLSYLVYVPFSSFFV